MRRPFCWLSRLREIAVLIQERNKWMCPFKIQLIPTTMSDPIQELIIHRKSTYSSDRNRSGRSNVAGGSSVWMDRRSLGSDGISKLVELPDKSRLKNESESIPSSKSDSSVRGMRVFFCCCSGRRCSNVAMVYSVSLGHRWRSQWSRKIPNLVSRAFRYPFFGPRRT